MSRTACPSNDAPPPRWENLSPSVLCFSVWYKCKSLIFGGFILNVNDLFSLHEWWLSKYSLFWAHWNKPTLDRRRSCVCGIPHSPAPFITLERSQGIEKFPVVSRLPSTPVDNWKVMCGEGQQAGEVLLGVKGMEPLSEVTAARENWWEVNNRWARRTFSLAGDDVVSSPTGRAVGPRHRKAFCLMRKSSKHLCGR